MPALFERIMDKYLHLDLYPDAMAALAAMRDRKLAILSNGSTAMLTALVRNTGLDRVLDATISVDAKKIFKPAPEAYRLIEKGSACRPRKCCSSRRTRGTPAAPRPLASMSPGSSGSRRKRWRWPA